MLAADIKSLFEDGFLVGETRFFAAPIAVKGDMEWHKRVYNLERSYALCGTVATGQICHLCLAGGGGPPPEDFDEIPLWSRTLFRQRPWNTDLPAPVLANIPGFVHPEEMLHLDPFHIVKMGIGRNIVGGILVYLVRRGFFDFDGSDGNSFPARLNRAHGHFGVWRVQRFRMQCGGLRARF